MKYGYRVSAMECKNIGTGYDGVEDIQWSCTANLPVEYQLGRTEVICEGYKAPNDKYILKGTFAILRI
jgi:store-operated calcium entry-associated regulatory factor